MADLLVTSARSPLRGVVPAPPDRALAEAAVLLGALTPRGAVSRVTARGLGPLPICEPLAALGVAVATDDAGVAVTGSGLDGLRAPATALVTGDSAMALTLVTSLVTALPFGATLHADDIVGRSCLRSIARVLRLRGGRLEGRFVHDAPGVLAPPVTIEPSPPLSALQGHHLPLGGFVEKVAALVSGLFAAGDTILVEPLVTDDRVTRLLQALGATLETAGGLTRLAPLGAPLPAFTLELPGQLDASLLLLAAALAQPDSAVGVRTVTVQPSDAAALFALRDAGAPLLVEPRRTLAGQATADLSAHGAPFAGFAIDGERAAAAGASLAALAAWASHARGDSVLTALPPSLTHPGDGSRVARVLTRFGVPAHWSEGEATLRVTGGALTKEEPAGERVIDPEGDGGVAMLATVLALAVGGTTRVRGADCVVARFPRFVGSLRALGASLTVHT